MRRPLSRPVLVIVVLHALAALTFGVLAHVDSTVQFPDLGSNTDADFAVSLYANRNIGIGVALLAGVAARRPLAIAGLMAARLVTDIGDLAVALTDLDDAGALGGQVIFFGLLFASEIYVLRALVHDTEPKPRAPEPTNPEVLQ